STVPGSGERRASCDFCSRRKRKCDGVNPCQNCRKLKLVCHFSVKQKSGRKRKPREGEAPTLHTPSRPPAPRANKTVAVGGSGKGSAASAMAAATAAAADSA
ncbi:unnamed protein product, partial [Ectocarpus sp. 12 AP-2014]